MRKSRVVLIAAAVGALVAVYAFRPSVTALLGRDREKPTIMKHGERFSYGAPAGAQGGTGLARSPWPMFRHDPMHTGRSPFRGPEVPDFQWEYMTKGAIESSPAVGPDGSIYVGSHDFHLYAFTPSGVLKWKFPTLGLIRSSPAIDGEGTVYIGSFDGNLYAINPDGRVKWSYFTGDPVLSSPTITSDGTILITSGGPSGGTLHSVDLEGERRWKLPLEGSVSVSSPTVLPDGVIFQVTYPGVMYAVSPDGNVKWQKRLEKDRGVRTTPAVSKDGTLYIGTRGGRLLAINPDGSVKWAFKARGDIRGSAAVAEAGTVYFGSYDQHLYALRPDGRLKWKFKTEGPIEVSPCVDNDGVVYFSAQGDRAYAVRPDGSLKWTYRRGVIYTSPVIGPDGTLYDSGDYAVRAVGPLFPAVDMSIASENVEVRVSNKSRTARALDLRVWGRDGSGKERQLFSERITVDAGGSFGKALSAAGDDVVLGARLLAPVTGEVLSEKVVFLPGRPRR